MAPKRKTYIQNCTGDGCAKKSNPHPLLARIIFYILLVSFIGASVFMLFFSMQMQINNVVISGTIDLDANELEQKIKNSLQGKYLSIIPKNNFLFISQNKIQKDFISDFKKIRSVKVEKKFPDSVTVTIEEHKTLLIWCRNEESCFLLDEEGVAYGEADFNSPELIQNNLLRMIDSSNAEVRVGDRIMESEYENYLLDIKTAASAIGVQVDDYHTTPSRMAEEIKSRTSHGFEIYFSTQFDLESAMKTLTVVLNKEIPQEKWGDVSYIDLRSEHKAFYKFKDVAPEQGEEKVDDKEVEKENLEKK